jgi:hypothetical protein
MQNAAVCMQGAAAVVEGEVLQEAAKATEALENE